MQQKWDQGTLVPCICLFNCLFVIKNNDFQIYCLSLARSHVSRASMPPAWSRILKGPVVKPNSTFYTPKLLQNQKVKSFEARGLRPSIYVLKG